MPLDPYGFPTDEPQVARRSGVARWIVGTIWLVLDLVVLVCSSAFTAFAWSNPDDPQYIVLFSAPFWGGAGSGTFVALLLGAWRAHWALQLVISVLVAIVAFFVAPTVWFAFLVALELAK